MIIMDDLASIARKAAILSLFSRFTEVEVEVDLKSSTDKIRNVAEVNSKYSLDGELILSGHDCITIEHEDKEGEDITSLVNDYINTIEQEWGLVGLKPEIEKTGNKIIYKIGPSHGQLLIKEYTVDEAIQILDIGEFILIPRIENQLQIARKRDLKLSILNLLSLMKNVQLYDKMEDQDLAPLLYTKVLEYEQLRIAKQQ